MGDSIKPNVGSWKALC